MSRWIVILIVALSNAAAPMVVADDPVNHGQKVENLISQLRSTNEAPRVNLPEPKYSTEFDHDRQKSISVARTKLIDMGLEAFPHLVKHVEDREYSYTFLIMSTYDNATVGGACYSILQSQLQPFGPYFALGRNDPRHRAHRPNYCLSHKLTSRNDAAIWWESHRGLSLRELQIEVVEWVISEESKSPAEYSDDERRFLAETLKSLRTSNLPLSPNLAEKPL